MILTVYVELEGPLYLIMYNNNNNNRKPTNGCNDIKFL